MAKPVENLEIKDFSDGERELGNFRILRSWEV
jgi:hypothetical protein